MTKTRSIARVAAKAVNADKKVRDQLAKMTTVGTTDSFQNLAQKLGVGANSPLSSASYGFNPITRNRILLEWIHRGSWLGGVAIDVIPEDMTRAGVDILGDNDPGDIQEVQKLMTELGVWTSIRETIQWSRLYGGAIGVIQIAGQQMKTPLRLETVGEDQFRGVTVFDRWMVEPSLNDLVTEPGPDLGLPKFYTVAADAPALPRQTIHYSRCIRLVGIQLPYWQRVMENLWGISVLERLYDRMISFDSATTGAAQLVYKAYLRVLKVKDLREIVAAGGAPLNGLVKQMAFMSNYQGIEGITMLDGEDEFEASSHSAFSGLSDALTQFAQQLSGALGIPLIRLFGQSPTGFNTGDADIRMYYDSIKQQQEKDLKRGVKRIYECGLRSLKKKPAKNFDVDFRSLWQLPQKEKSEIASTDVETVMRANDAGLISDKTALLELKQSSRVTGIFTNITQEDINSASEEAVPKMELGGGDDGGGEGGGAKGPPEDGEPSGGPADEPKTKKRTKDMQRRRARDSMTAVGKLKALHNLDVVVENVLGTYREGKTYRSLMPAHYGYIQRTVGEDGDQVDCFIGSNPESDHVLVIPQYIMGKLDEYKCMLGFDDPTAAFNTYVASYNNGDMSVSITSAPSGSRSQKEVAWLSMPDFQAFLEKMTLPS